MGEVLRHCAWCNTGVTRCSSFSASYYDAPRALARREKREPFNIPLHRTAGERLLVGRTGRRDKGRARANPSGQPRAARLPLLLANNLSERAGRATSYRLSRPRCSAATLPTPPWSSSAAERPARDREGAGSTPASMPTSMPNSLEHTLEWLNGRAAGLPGRVRVRLPPPGPTNPARPP